jgi:hypothetical protein
MLHCFLAKGGVIMASKRFVKNLMNKNPAHQPSFIDRSGELLDTTPCDDGDMGYVDEEGGNKELKAQAKNDFGNKRKRRRIWMSGSKADICYGK